MSGGAYEVVWALGPDVWPRTVTVQRSLRPVPGAVWHVISSWSRVTLQPVATYSVPPGP
jgi:hypothetical protein